MRNYSILIENRNEILDQKHQHKFINADKFKSIEFHYNENKWMHNINGPAVIYKNGTIMYYYDGWYHNTNGPAIITHTDKKYYIMGKYVEEKNFKKQARLFKYKCLQIFD